MRGYVALGAAAFVVVAVGYQPTGFGPAVLRTDAEVRVVQTGGDLTFSPAKSPPAAGLLFLPGAMVAPDAYAPLARTLAAVGYRVTILSLPYRLAPSQCSVTTVMTRAAATIAAAPSIRHWAVAGHSKGGLLAAKFARDHGNLIEGLVLIGTSHPDAASDLSGSRLDVTKVYATRDGFATPERVEANARYLPPDTHWVRIEGGNHAQFGHYRYQIGDRSATISRDRQQHILAQAIENALARIAE
jgi:pimeloyl-ACP methyl ester carboxylesterase